MDKGIKLFISILLSVFHSELYLIKNNMIQRHNQVSFPFDYMYLNKRDYK